MNEYTKKNNTLIDPTIKKGSARKNFQTDPFCVTSSPATTVSKGKFL